MAYEASTEDIRAAWYGLTQNTDSFDLWLIKERERVINLASAVFKKDEQERIIKIIERINNHGMTHSEKCLRHHLFAEQALKEINK
jgi:hypothetical protein